MHKISASGLRILSFWRRVFIIIITITSGIKITGIIVIFNQGLISQQSQKYFEADQLNFEADQLKPGFVFF